MKSIRKFFLEANPNPKREGCPDEKTLKDIAGEPSARGSSGPAASRLLLAMFCGVSKLQSRGWGGACIAIEDSCVGTCGLSRHRSWIYGSRAMLRRPAPQTAGGGTQDQAGQLAAVEQTIDLYNHGTPRGGSEPSPLEAVSLPSALVHLRFDPAAV